MNTVRTTPGEHDSPSIGKPTLSNPTIDGARGVQGLTSEEAEIRLKQFGANALPEREPHPLTALLKKFWAPVPWMLEATIAMELGLQKYPEAGVIAALLVFNASLSLVQERKAASALSLLRKQLPVKARVMRDAKWTTVDSRQIVPGDLVYLRVGDLVPADALVTEGQVEVDQSALTGESLPVDVERGQAAYAGSTIRHGEAKARVTATGKRTYFGHTADLVNTVKTISHLQNIIFTIVKYLIAVDLLLAVAVILFGWFLGLSLRDLLPFALMLLVASVPVALPATFTLATALGSMELARAGVLVTRLSAIEEAAAMEILLSDKTGTLTANRLTVTEARPYDECSTSELLQLASLASDEGSRDPIDFAIFQAVRQGNAGVPAAVRINYVPFDPATKVAEATVTRDGVTVHVVKGFPEFVAQRTAQLPPWQIDLKRLAAHGSRVIAVASSSNGGNYKFAGLIALEDPPRADSQVIVSQLQDLGVHVVMVTGDSPATAAVVAGQVGIGTNVCPTKKLKSLTSAEMQRYDVFAGVYPEDKLRLIQEEQSSGRVCGMTGDGVNDTPALKQAEVGIAVANATDVAKAAASLVLTNPGLRDVLSAVQTSRKIYQRMLTYTLNKVIKTIEIAVFLSVGILATRQFVITPLLIVLLLFTNDFVTMSIATDNVRPSPGPDRWDIPTLVLTAGSLAAVILMFSFAVFFTARDVFHLNLPQLQTLAFAMLVFTGQGTVYLVRERKSFWKSRPSGLLILSSVIDIVTVSLMAINGVLMTKIPWSAIAGLLVATAAFLVILDTFKVKVFRRLAI